MLITCLTTQKEKKWKRNQQQRKRDWVKANKTWVDTWQHHVIPHPVYIKFHRTVVDESNTILTISFFFFFVLFNPFFNYPFTHTHNYIPIHCNKKSYLVYFVACLDVGCMDECVFLIIFVCILFRIYRNRILIARKLLPRACVTWSLLSSSSKTWNKQTDCDFEHASNTNNNINYKGTAAAML